DTVFILPSKRAGFFLRKELIKQNSKPIFSPQILSIEQFVEHISDLKIVDQTLLISEMYGCYLELTEDEEKENIETFSAWATTLLNDINEIDLNMADANGIFEYLSQIKEIEHWYVKEEKTTLIKNYLSFWQSLPEYYQLFTEKLMQQGLAYQGLA